MLESIERATGRVVKWQALGGEWGVPAVAFDGTAGGLTRDGGTLVLADWGPPENGALRASSDFQLVDTETLRTRGRVSLDGDFAFDALSPDGSTLYLVEHVPGEDTTRSTDERSASGSHGTEARIRSAARSFASTAGTC
jgi:hypothetical protein